MDKKIIKIGKSKCEIVDTLKNDVNDKYQKVEYLLRSLENNGIIGNFECTTRDSFNIHEEKKGEKFNFELENGDVYEISIGVYTRNNSMNSYFYIDMERKGKLSSLSIQYGTDSKTKEVKHSYCNRLNIEAIKLIKEIEKNNDVKVHEIYDSIEKYETVFTQLLSIAR